MNVGQRPRGSIQLFTISRYLTKVSFTDLTKRAHKVQLSAVWLRHRQRDPAKTLARHNKAIS
jgi:hypothetical protein